MNPQILEVMREVISEVANKYAAEFNLVRIDTSEKGSSTKTTCERVAAKVLEWIEEDLQENILWISDVMLDAILGGRHQIGRMEASEIVDLFSKHGGFSPRSRVEGDVNKVQALPVVIVRNSKGDVLRLRRKEKDETNALHEKIVIWAGGHVREEDSQSGNPILNCAVRELEEELRLSVEPESLALRGVIHAKVDSGTTKHRELYT